MMAEKTPVIGESKLIEELAFDMMKVPAVKVDPVMKTMAKTEQVGKFAALIAELDCCTGYPREWNGFNPKQAESWGNLPWPVLMRVQNDFLWAVKNFFGS